MLMTPYGNGLGALTKGKDFNCSSTICYGVGVERHKMFQNLQSLLNIFSTPVGFAPLVVDGFIGESTTKAAALAARAIRGSGYPGAESAVVATIAKGVSKEQLAGLADEYNLILAAVGPILQADRINAGLPTSPYVAATPINNTTAPAAVAPGKSADDAMKKLSPPAKRRWLWWVLGGVAVVGAVGVGGYIYYRRTGHAV